MSNKELYFPVHYLESSDFYNDGTLNIPNIPSNMPVVVVIMADFCGFCTMAKPALQEFADEHQGEVFVATIKGDSKKPSEVELKNKLREFFPDFRGYPYYALYKNGRKVDKQIRGRDKRSLEEFAFK